MPMYDFLCRECDKEIELFYTLKEYNSEPKCPYCTNKMVRIFTPSMVMVHDYSQYVPQLGKDAERKIKSGEVVPVDSKKPDEYKTKKKPYKFTREDFNRVGLN